MAYNISMFDTFIAEVEEQLLTLGSMVKGGHRIGSVKLISWHQEKSQYLWHIESPPPLVQRKTKGETEGRGKHTIKPLPKNGFETPTYDTFPPRPFCSHPVVFLRGNRHRPDESHLLRPPKLGLEGALYPCFACQHLGMLFPNPNFYFYLATSKNAQNCQFHAC